MLEKSKPHPKSSREEVEKQGKGDKEFEYNRGKLHNKVQLVCNE